MNIETKWLEDLVALAATRSFSQAAERRFVTQPAFSRRIRSLENTLGLTLVNRARTPIELTEAGQLFLVTARNMVEQLGEVVHYLGTPPPPAASSLLPFLAGRVRSSHSFELFAILRAVVLLLFLRLPMVWRFPLLRCS